MVSAAITAKIWWGCFIARCDSVSSGLRRMKTKTCGLQYYKSAIHQEFAKREIVARLSDNERPCVSCLKYRILRCHSRFSTSGKIMAAIINPDAPHVAHCALEPSSVRIAASSATAERRNDARKNFSFPEAMTGNPSAINIKQVATTRLTIFLLRKGGKSLSSSAEMPKNITTIPQQRSTKVAMMNEALALDSISGLLAIWELFELFGDRPRFLVCHNELYVLQLCPALDLANGFSHCGAKFRLGRITYFSPVFASFCRLCHLFFNSMSSRSNLCRDFNQLTL